MTTKVEVRGIRELNKALKEVDGDLPKAMKEGFRRVSQMVVDAASQKVPVLTGKASRSIKPRSSQKGAAIAFGGSAAPYEPWLDFGGAVGRNRSIKRTFIKSGRYVYPTIKELNPEIVDLVDKEIGNVIREAKFETRGDN